MRRVSEAVYEGVSMMFNSETSRKLDKLELKYEVLREDFGELHQFVKEHMQQEEEDRKFHNKVLFWMV